MIGFLGLGCDLFCLVGARKASTNMLVDHLEVVEDYVPAIDVIKIKLKPMRFYRREQQVQHASDLLTRVTELVKCPSHSSGCTQ